MESYYNVGEIGPFKEKYSQEDMDLISHEQRQIASHLDYMKDTLGRSCFNIIKINKKYFPEKE